MISFSNDYSEGASLAILDRLSQCNFNQYVGYGCDEICDSAKVKMKQLLQYEDCDIHFLVGGTQSNATVIDHALKPYEAVIAWDSGHINVHETGAIEANGHKVITCKNVDGKITCKDIEYQYQLHSDEHMVKPAMVYISDATEVGTIYSYQELKAIKESCEKLGLYLFIDGARLAVALTSNENDVKVSDLCSLCDIFYFGGTKNGALFGEAIVIVNDELKKNFRYSIKQHGGMLAKGFLLGIQFDELFTNDIYFENARHANKMASKLQDAFIENGFSLLVKSPTNQIFPILSKTVIEQLKQKYIFQFWEAYDEDHDVIRFVTSWATKEEAVDQLIYDLKQL